MKVVSELKTIRTVLLVVLIILGAVSVARYAAGSSRMGQMLDWKKVLIVYDAYVDDPIKKNAVNLLNALPKDRINEAIGDTEAAMRYIFSPDNYPVLYEEAISGDKIAIEILFRLLNIADGGYLELLENNLGWIARDKPRLFLETAKLYENTVHAKRFGCPASFVGGEIMHLGAVTHILKKRLEALQSIRDPELAEIRDACIMKIKKALEKRTKKTDKER